MAAHKGQKKAGGRKKGTPNRATAKREAEIAKTGKTPLQFLIDRMRNRKADMAERIDCAKAAAPYVHPRAATTVNLDAKLNITEVRDVIVDPRDPDHDRRLARDAAPDDPQAGWQAAVRPNEPRSDEEGGRVPQAGN